MGANIFSLFVYRWSSNFPKIGYVFGRTDAPGFFGGVGFFGTDDCGLLARILSLCHVLRTYHFAKATVFALH